MCEARTQNKTSRSSAQDEVPGYAGGGRGCYATLVLGPWVPSEPEDPHAAVRFHVLHLWGLRFLGGLLPCNRDCIMSEAWYGNRTSRFGTSFVEVPSTLISALGDHRDSSAQEAYCWTVCSGVVCDREPLLVVCLVLLLRSDGFRSCPWVRGVMSMILDHFALWYVRGAMILPLWDVK
jgi:hypothetical protein